MCACVCCLCCKVVVTIIIIVNYGENSVKSIFMSRMRSIKFMVHAVSNLKKKMSSSTLSESDTSTGASFDSLLTWVSKNECQMIV